MDVAGLHVSVLPGESPDAPLVVLNSFEDDAGEVRRIAGGITDADFSLLSVSELDWDADLTPWEAPGLGMNDEPFSGGAGRYLGYLTGTVMPLAEKEAGLEPSHRYLAGYSLAGLFALYAMYLPSPFTRFASMSGSLWFPGFRGFVEGNRPPTADRIYLSLGEREPKTRHPLTSKVGEETEAIYGILKSQVPDTVFEWNPGNHFTDPAGRTAKGIAHLLY